MKDYNPQNECSLYHFNGTLLRLLSLMSKSDYLNFRVYTNSIFLYVTIAMTTAGLFSRIYRPRPRVGFKHRYLTCIETPRIPFCIFMTLYSLYAMCGLDYETSFGSPCVYAENVTSAPFFKFNTSDFILSPNNFVHWKTRMSEIVIASTIGFYLMDIIAISLAEIYYGVQQKILLMHHYLTLMLFMVLYEYQQGQAYGIAFLMVKMTSPLVSVQAISMGLRIEWMTKSAWFHANNGFITHLFHLRHGYELFLCTTVIGSWEEIRREMETPVTICLCLHLATMFLLISPNWVWHYNLLCMKLLMMIGDEKGRGFIQRRFENVGDFFIDELGPIIGGPRNDGARGRGRGGQVRGRGGQVRGRGVFPNGRLPNGHVS